MFTSSWIERLIMDKRLEMDKEKQKEDALVVYEYLILQHAALKCIIENKYDVLMNVNIFEKFIFKVHEKKILAICASGIGQSRNSSCKPRNLNGLCC